MYYVEPQPKPSKPDTPPRISHGRYALNFLVASAAVTTLGVFGPRALIDFDESRKQQMAFKLLEGVESGHALIGIETQTGNILPIEFFEAGKFKAIMSGMKGNRPVYVYYPEKENDGDFTKGLMCRVSARVNDAASADDFRARLARSLRASIEHSGAAIGRLCDMPQQDIKNIITQITTNRYTAPAVQAAAVETPGPFSTVAKNGAVMEQLVVRPKISNSKA